MGRKLNLEYREGVRQRHKLPFCYCGRRTRNGVHKGCQQWIEKTLHKTYAECLELNAPRWLLSGKLAEESPELDATDSFNKIFSDILNRERKWHKQWIESAIAEPDEETPDWLQ